MASTPLPGIGGTTHTLVGRGVHTPKPMMFFLHILPNSAKMYKFSTFFPFWASPILTTMHLRIMLTTYWTTLRVGLVSFVLQEIRLLSYFRIIGNQHKHTPRYCQKREPREIIRPTTPPFGRRHCTNDLSAFAPLILGTLYQM